MTFLFSEKRVEMKHFQKLDVLGVSLVATMLALIFNFSLLVLCKITSISVLVPKQLGHSELVPLGLLKLILATSIPIFLAGFLYWSLTKIFKEKGIRDFLVVCVVFFLFSLGGPLSLPISLLSKAILVGFHTLTAYLTAWIFVTYHKTKYPLKKSNPLPSSKQ
jgi:hypothetical protein